MVTERSKWYFGTFEHFSATSLIQHKHSRNQKHTYWRNIASLSQSIIMLLFFAAQKSHSSLHIIHTSLFFDQKASFHISCQSFIAAYCARGGVFLNVRQILCFGRNDFFLFCLHILISLLGFLRSIFFFCNVEGMNLLAVLVFSVVVKMLDRINLIPNS